MFSIINYIFPLIWKKSKILISRISDLWMSRRGFEPLTLWLKVRCSTDWANGSCLYVFTCSKQFFGILSKWMAGPAGFEPAHHGVKVRCLTTWLRPIDNTIVILPTLLKRILSNWIWYQWCHYYLKWWRGTDSNRRTLRERIYSPPRLATSLPLQKLYVLIYADCRTWTRNLLITIQLLYQLS
jgi:hypothetical protein